MTFASRSTAQKKSWIFGLPGNPTSAFATFHLFVLPALRKYCGYDAPRLSLPILQMEVLTSPKVQFYLVRNKILIVFFFVARQ